MPTNNSIIIIGAGIAGLSAGCYAQMNGYNSQIFELHNIPGGLCTTWKRKGYTYDGCIHYLFGSGKVSLSTISGRNLAQFREEQFVNHDVYMEITDGKQTLTVYANPDDLQSHMTEISPSDAGLIRAFCNGVRAFTEFDMSAMYQIPKSLMKPTDWMKLGKKMLPFVPVLARWATLSTQQFAEKFTNPFLRRAVAHMFSWEEAPVMMGMMLLAYLYKGNAGYPLGASLEFARAIEQRYLSLGGIIHYDAQVEKILTENGRATGVRLYNDEVHYRRPSHLHS